MSSEFDEPPDWWPTDEELAEYGYIQGGRRVRTIASTPRVGQCFWVDFPRDAFKPEFDREHPCVVVRGAQKLDDDTCVVVPLTHAEQRPSLHTHKLSKNPNPKDRKAVWAVCDHLYTVNLFRLRAFKNRTGTPVYPKLDQADLDAIFAAIRVALHHVYGAPMQPTAAAVPPPVKEVMVVTKPKRRPAKAKAAEEPKPKLGPSGRPVLSLPSRPPKDGKT